MELLPGILIILGLVIFMVGYYYIAKSVGQSECSRDKKEIEGSQSANYIGGIVGVVIAVILVIIGFILNSQTAKAAIIKTLSTSTPSPAPVPRLPVSAPVPRPPVPAPAPRPVLPPRPAPASVPRAPPAPVVSPTFTPPPAYRGNM